MSGPETLSEAQRWLRYAAEDLRAAEGMLTRDDSVPRHACWLAQQAAEKALKAALVFLGISHPRRHDLDALRNLLSSEWSIKTDEPDLAELTEWAVEARYPGDWAEASFPEARESVSQAQRVLESIRDDLRLRGLP